MSSIKTEMMSLLATEYITGEEHRLDRYVSKIKSISSFQQATRELFVSACEFGITQRIIGLLHMLSRLDKSKRCMEFDILATYALHHEDIEVRDAAIRCFESWGKTKTLRYVNYGGTWLQSYVDDVLGDNVRE